MAITVVSSSGTTGAANATATSGTTSRRQSTHTSSITAGNAILAIVAYRGNNNLDAGGILTSVDDSLGNSYTLIAASGSTANNDFAKVRMAYCSSSASGTPTFNANFGVGLTGDHIGYGVEIYAIELNGMHATSAVVQLGTTSGGTATHTSATISTSAADPHFLVCGTAVFMLGATDASYSGWTNSFIEVFDPTTGPTGFGVATRSVSSGTSGSWSTAATCSSANERHTAILALRGAADAGGGVEDITLSVTHDLAAAVQVSASAPVSVSATHDLAAAVAVSADVPVSVSATHDLAASVAVSASVPISVAATHDLAAAVSVSATAPITLSITRDLAAAVVLDEGATGDEAITLGITHDLAVSVVVQALRGVTVATTHDIAAAVAVAATVPVSLSVAHDLAAEVAVVVIGDVPGGFEADEQTLHLYDLSTSPLDLVGGLNLTAVSGGGWSTTASAALLAELGAGITIEREVTVPASGAGTILEVGAWGELSRSNVQIVIGWDSGRHLFVGWESGAGSDFVLASGAALPVGVPIRVTVTRTSERAWILVDGVALVAAVDIPAPTGADAPGMTFSVGRRVTTSSPQIYSGGGWLRISTVRMLDEIQGGRLSIDAGIARLAIDAPSSTLNIAAGTTTLRIGDDDMADFVTKVGATKTIPITLTNADGTPFDPAGSTVRIHISKPGQPLVLDAIVTETIAAGQMEYEWTADVAAGTYRCEVKATRADGSDVYFPEDGFETVRVVAGLG